MPTEKVPLQGCPVESCELTVGVAFKTTDGTKLTTSNMTQARTCLYPTTLDGEPASYIIFHDSLDDTVEPVKAAESDATDPADADADAPDPEELPPILEHVYATLKRQTTGGTPIEQGALAGKCIDHDIAPSDVHEAVDDLCERDLVAKTDDGLVPA